MQIFITDKTGRRFWNTNVSAAWAQGERKNLSRHLDMIKARHPSYAKCRVDADTARMVEELDARDAAAADISDLADMSDDDLLAELLA
jgi:hypothetical protein